MKKIEDNKFDWNDVVKVKSNAPKYLHPGEIASVCGMTKIEFAEVAEEYSTKIGKWIYTIEFKDGSDIELSEYYLEKYQADQMHKYTYDPLAQP